MDSSFASLQQKSKSSLMPSRRERLSFTWYEKNNGLFSDERNVRVFRFLYHSEHGSFRFAWASQAGNFFASFIAYLCRFLKRTNNFLEEIAWGSLENLWNCPLLAKTERRNHHGYKKLRLDKLQFYRIIW